MKPRETERKLNAATAEVAANRDPLNPAASCSLLAIIRSSVTDDSLPERPVE